MKPWIHPKAEPKKQQGWNFLRKNMCEKGVLVARNLSSLQG